MPINYLKSKIKIFIKKGERVDYFLHSGLRGGEAKSLGDTLLKK